MKNNDLAQILNAFDYIGIILGLSRDNGDNHYRLSNPPPSEIIEIIP